MAVNVSKPQRQKDPKKVAAGRAGAAARKAKQERVLEELRTVKATLKGSCEASDTTCQAKPQEHCDTAHSAAGGQGKDKNGSDIPSEHLAARHYVSSTSWTPWILAIAGIAAVGMYASCRVKPGMMPLQATSSLTARQAPKNELSSLQPPVTQHLKVGKDPFYME